MNTSRAICTLESMAIDMVGTLGGLDKANPITPVLERQIEAINMAQDALRAVRDLATNENASHISIDRMNEIMQAEREGRLVILPFLPNQDVWDYSEFFDGTPYAEYYKLRDGFIGIGISESGKRTFEYDCITIDPEQIGKTVFLSRDEAEKALEEAR